MDSNAKTFLVDAHSIRRRIILDPDFSKYLLMWHDRGSPQNWHLIETRGGAYDYPFELDEYELRQLGVSYEPSVKTSWCNQYYFSDLAGAFL